MNTRAVAILPIVLLSWSLACQKTASKEEEWGLIAQTLPWAIPMLQTCEAYKSSENELDKKDLATKTLNMIRKAEVKNAQGKVDAVTPGGANMPDEYVLQIAIGQDFRFNSQTGKRPIKRGDPIFERVASLKQGQCVIFSARNLESIAPYTSGKLCDPQFYAEFTSIEPCP